MKLGGASEELEGGKQIGSQYLVFNYEIARE